MWVNAFNNVAVEKIVVFYRDNTVNHQVANEPVVGKNEIKTMFTYNFGKAKIVCIIENIFCDGEWTTLEWKYPLDLRRCGFFHIVDDKIIFQRGYFDKLTF